MHALIAEHGLSSRLPRRRQMGVLKMKPLNIAHRGGGALRPENTMAAFRHAVALGADGAELDVQLSADGVAVVHHDYRLNPGLTRKDGAWLMGETPRIKDLHFAELQHFDLSRADPASDYARAHPLLAPEDGARIPSVREVAALPESFLLMVELKSSTNPDSADPLALADATLAVMKDQLSRTIFVGFDWRGLARIKARAKEARCWFTTDELQGDARMVLEFIKAAGGDGWFPRYQDVTPDLAAHARAKGLQVGAWTVNTPDEMKRLIDLQMDAICTDHPDLLRSML
jgi:glycerophosphoryl diester phosphodiesterase